MCDFNQALTVNEAILRGRQLDDEGGLYWIEEPTRADDFAGNRRIADALTTPVQIGENFMGPEQMAQALAAQASDYVMSDAQRIGGVTGWMRGAALAQGAGLEMSSHLFPEAELPPAGRDAHRALARIRRLGRAGAGMGGRSVAGWRWCPIARARASMG